MIKAIFNNHLKDLKCLGMGNTIQLVFESSNGKGNFRYEIFVIYGVPN